MRRNEPNQISIKVSIVDVTTVRISEVEVFVTGRLKLSDAAVGR